MISPSKQLKKQLREAITDLPDMLVQKEVILKISGKELLANGTAIDKNKKPVKGNIMYKYKGVKQTPVNHLQQVKEAYRAKGWPGVEEYKTMITTRHAELTNVKPVILEPAKI